MKRLNDAATRIIYVKLKLGLFEKQFEPWQSYPKFASPEFKATAKNAALESITLLKNEDNALPLNKNEKVLLIGEAANNLIFQNGAWTHTWQGEDTSHNTKGNSTIYQALSQKLGDKLTFIQGYDLKSVNGWESCSTLDIEKVKSAAQQSDKIIICLGEMPATEKPGDVKTLNLCEEQQQLVKELQSIGKPVILVLLFGKPHIIREIEPKSEAILHAYLPGDYGSEALSEIILGEANPSGKLPITFPRHEGQLPLSYWHEPTGRGSDYIDGTGLPLFPFGYGKTRHHTPVPSCLRHTVHLGIAHPIVHRLDAPRL
jgi:beta-glucosidase